MDNVQIPPHGYFVHFRPRYEELDQVHIQVTGHLVWLNQELDQVLPFPWSFGSAPRMYKELDMFQNPPLGLLIQCHPGVRSWIRSKLLDFWTVFFCTEYLKNSQATLGRLQWRSSRWQTHPAAFQHSQEPDICVYSQMDSTHSFHSSDSHVETNTECICAFQKEKETAILWCRLKVVGSSCLANGVPPLKSPSLYWNM